MRTSNRILCKIIGAIAILYSSSAWSQLTKTDYERALNSSVRYQDMTEDVVKAPSWIQGEDALFYSKTVQGGHQYFIANAENGNKQVAFDHQRLAASLNEATHEGLKPLDLPLTEVQVVDHRSAIEFSLGQKNWRCNLSNYRCEMLHRHGDEENGREEAGSSPNSLEKFELSPDKRWKAMVDNYNVDVLSADGRQRVTLSTDGSEGNYYDLHSVAWSPNSRYLVAYRIKPGYKRMVHYIESSPATQLQPLYSEMEYAKPGDVLDLQQPVLFDVTGKREIPIDNTLFPNPYELSGAAWWKDSRGFTFEYNQRGHQLYRVIEVNAEGGAARALIDEASNTFVDYQPLAMDLMDTGKKYRYDIADGKQIIWASERDGWEHLYLIDGATGKVELAITTGDWVVRAVDRVDEQRHQIWFEASGMNAGEDPYYVHAYRINFDGTGLTPLTPSAGNHRVEYSDDGKYYLDQVSTIENPPVLTVYRSEGNQKIAELERGKIDKLVAAGWHAPEVFSAKGRDGKTDIWGVVWKPAHFDPTQKYPVIEDIYAGPQGSFVPKSFSTRTEPLTELGFVVVQIDGMGTNNRSKAFHDVVWKNLKDAGFPDRILWHKAYAASHPWYDISRVGIFGTSAGGQSALGALLFHPEFYKAAVANSGCYDNRMDKIWWNEQWMGWPVGPQYSESSGVDNAWRLQGKLMLIVGEMDKNVDPSSTFQVVDRLEKANKMFDLLYVPGGGHGAGGSYGQKKMMDFFVHNLLSESTPDWNANQ